MKMAMDCKSRIVRLALLAASLTLCSCGVKTVSAVDDDILSATAQKSDLQLRFLANGLVKATESRIVTAPAVAGGSLRLVRIATTGSFAHKDDVVLEFDPSQQEYNLAQARSDLAQAEQEILKDQADAEVQAAEDQTALLKAKYAVRRAELDVSKNELLSEIDAKKNVLALEEAKRALAQLQVDIQSHTTSDQAALALSEEKRNKARLAMQLADTNIQNMRVKAPIDGLLVVHGNPNSMGGVMFGGMTLPEYHVGDTANPGDTVAEVIDLGKMEISSQVSERDRPYIKAGQSVEIYVEALRNEKFPGKIENVAGSTSNGFFIEDQQRKFAVTSQLDRSDARMRPGFTCRLVLLGEQLPQALTIPNEAVFERSGKTVAYLRKSGAWQAQEIKVKAYSEGRAVIESGLKPGDTVALVNPEKRASPKQQPESVGPALGGGS
jgi:HlyD family secretion protein